MKSDRCKVAGSNWCPVDTLQFKVLRAEYPTMHEFSLTHAGDEGPFRVLSIYMYTRIWSGINGNYFMTFDLAITLYLMDNCQIFQDFQDRPFKITQT